MTTIFPPAPRHPSCPASGRIEDLPVLRDTEDAGGLLLHLPVRNMTVVPGSRVHGGWFTLVTASSDRLIRPGSNMVCTDQEIATAIEVEGDADEALRNAFRQRNMDLSDVFEHATEFTFAPAGSRPDDVDFQLYLVQVRYRDGGWEITNLNRTWDGTQWVADSGWVPDPARRAELRSSRSFDRDSAVVLARQLVETVEHLGLTWAARKKV